MSWRLTNLTLDTLADLPGSCRSCVLWELGPAVPDGMVGDESFEKEAWLSRTLLEWGGCGQLAYVDDKPAGHVLYAPPAYLPGSQAFPTAPVSPDAVLLATVVVTPDRTGEGVGRMLVEAAARDLARRGVRAMEAFGVTRCGEPGPAGASNPGACCVAPAQFLAAVGFRTVRAHHRFPRLRMELGPARSWRAGLGYAVERLVDTGPAWLPRPVALATT